MGEEGILFVNFIKHQSLTYNLSKNSSISEKCPISVSLLSITNITEFLGYRNPKVNTAVIAFLKNKAYIWKYLERDRIHSLLKAFFPCKQLTCFLLTRRKDIELSSSK